jgi:hypothetical protein
VVHTVFGTEVGQLVDAIGHGVVVVENTEGPQGDAGDGVPPLEELECGVRVLGVCGDDPNAGLAAGKDDVAIGVGGGRDADRFERGGWILRSAGRC